LNEVLLCIFQFNFVGKLLGPKGNSMKRLQEETMCKMAVLGKGSMKDRQKVSFRVIFYVTSLKINVSIFSLIFYFSFLFIFFNLRIFIMDK
jgi:hypothetical protein